MRRYELRVLPLGRAGTCPPFARQHRTDGAGASDKEGDAIADAGTVTASGAPPLPGPRGVSLRRVRSRSVGRLVTVRGMVVRASDVKPACVVATYTCDECGCEIYQVVANKREFMPQRLCPSEQCGNRPRSAETLHLQTRGSKFVKFQELKLQELPNQVPMGHIPRSMSVHCRGDLTRMACPGDVVTIDGVFLPQRVAESGYRAMQAGLVSTTFLEAQNVAVHKKSYDESQENSSQEERRALDKAVMSIATGPDPVGALSSAIAPEIFGHEDVKRSLLLQLVGGVTRKLPDGMRIRGDVNVCLMGDPGVAKSQLLKHVASIAPRGVYTTGKGSSGVGLTAAVTKDVATGEMALEGGALVLADRGICAIDEFDKMDEADRTAIHEVMEQQTVSVAKAGIVATLNARAAVLAAANPLYGRYNRNKSLSENVNLPNSLLSRFDLMFLILDVADVDRDMALARHVTFVHQNEGLEDAAGNGAGGGAKGRGPRTITDDEDDIDMEDDDLDDMDDDDDNGADQGGQRSRKSEVTPRLLREYIARARRHQPVVPPDVAPYIVEAYVGLRMQDGQGGGGRPGGGPDGGGPGDQTAMTARQLLSILRLGQALGRLRFSDYVAREDVDEAIRLTHMSKASLIEQEYRNAPGAAGGGGQGAGGGGGARSRGKQGEDATSRIFHILKDYATASRTSRVELKLCEAMVLRKGFTARQLGACLEEYQALDVLEMNATKTHVAFIGS
uniref:DNA replication licensing factor MCM7 n=1 Tax=Odontella aurita TaxID=265563 RepID=A0A7S4NB39_9STRA|mmetsp:Transcript_55220/g.165436  ORF Transcript_55220/g.165436 Transcript_55220/m.165436 type:complete len:732 (+) Transcript_55220:1439-3634(+)